MFINIKTRYYKEIAVRPVLTAWMDSASGCIVGWVISILPNSDTIAEAFCRACTYTLGDKFTGLPHSVIMDCGKDYKSALLEDIPDYYRKAVESEESFCLNRRFSGLGILRAFSVDVYHCLPYHPQSKPIERCFSSIENQIEKLPGWCYRKPSDRPPGFQKYIDTLLKEKELYTLEEFSEKFAVEILPAYHGQIDNSVSNLEIPGWTLDIKNMTPMQRYENLTKSRTLIPSYKTVSIIKKHFEPNCLIQGQGIRLQYVYYDADELKSLRGQHVDILYFKVTKPFAPSSVTVIYQSEYLCEAFPVTANSYTETASKILSELSHEQNKQAGNIHKAVTKIRTNVSDINIPIKHRKSEIQTLINAIKYHPGIIFLFDEVTADPIKLSLLRKIYEDAHVPIVICGIPLLYSNLYDSRHFDDFCSVTSRIDEHEMHGMRRVDAGSYLNMIAEKESVRFSYKAQQMLIATALNSSIGGIHAFTTIIGRCITLARVLYYNSPGHSFPDNTQCIRPALPDGKAYPGAELILTPPATPEPVTIDEAMVGQMQSEYKSHFPKVAQHSEK